MNEQAWKEQAALEPCPFCGNYPHPYVQNDDCPLPGDYGKDGGRFYRVVWCEKCGAEGGKRETDTEAIAAWNRRPLVQQAIAAERGEPVDVAKHHPLCSIQKGERCDYDCAREYTAPPTEAQIRAAERERCAKVADEHRCKPDSPVHRGTDNTARMIAAAIRSLKESDNGTG